MLRSLKYVALIFILLLVAVVTIGFIAGPVTQLSHTTVIRSQARVVWRTLTETDNMPAWNPHIIRVDRSGNSALKKGEKLRFFLRDYGPGLYHEEEVVSLAAEKQIGFLRKGRNKNPFMDNCLTEFQIKGLGDGTTEITTLITYRATHLTARVYNILFLRRVMNQRAQSSLFLLKRLLENV